MNTEYLNYSREEKDEIQRKMAESYDTIAKIAARKDRPIKDVVQQFRSGKLTVTDSEKTILLDLPSIEQFVLKGYGKLALNWAKRFYLKEKEFKNGIQHDDYSQEAMLALMNSIYYYDGSVEFTTFATVAIKNGLQSYVENDSSLSPINKRILKLRYEINAQMDKLNISFDEAVAKLKLSERDKKEVIQSLIRTVNEGDSKWDFPISDIDYTLKSEEWDLILQAFHSSELSDFERDLVLADMNGEKLVSVTTKYNHSRMAGTLALRKALGLIKLKYDELTAA